MTGVLSLELVNGNRYCLDTEMPLAVMEKNELKPLCDETNIIISA